VIPDTLMSSTIMIDEKHEKLAAERARSEQLSPQSSSSSPRTHQREEEIRISNETNLLVDNFLPPPYTYAPPEGAPPGYAPPIDFSKPFCLPQINAQWDSPFCRGYNENLPISREAWTKFVEYVYHHKAFHMFR
jgi:hypothetical protein